MENSGVNDFDCDGYRPIHHAVLANDIERAHKLLVEGAMLNASTESGDGILVLLCKALRDEEAIAWLPSLYDWGAEIIDTDRKGWSALHHAVKREMPLTIRSLMEAGADPFLRAVDGTRPVDLASAIATREENPRSDIRELLKTKPI